MMKSLRQGKQRRVGGGPHGSRQKSWGSGQQVVPEFTLSQRVMGDLKPILSSQMHGSPGNVPPAPDLSLVTMAHIPSVTLGLGSFLGGSLIETEVPSDQHLPKARSQDPRMVYCGFVSPGWVKGNLHLRVLVFVAGSHSHEDQGPGFGLGTQN